MLLSRIGMMGGIALVLASVGCAVTVPPSVLPSATAIPPSSTPMAESATSVPESPTSTPESVPSTPSDPPPTEVLPSPTPSPPLAARVNGEPIYLADYEGELARYASTLRARGVDLDTQAGQEKLEQAREGILEVMIEQFLIDQAAAEAGVEVRDDEVEDYMRDLVAEAGGEESFRDKLAAWGETYEGARLQVRAQLLGMAMTRRVVDAVPESAEQVRARHILVDTPEEAKVIHEELAGGADFAALAESRSQDPNTRDFGGDLGFFPRGVLVAASVEEVAFALHPGQFSDVVTSSFGYHIVQVVERDPDKPISSRNLQVLREQAVQRWIEDLWARADVERLVETAP